MDEGATDISWEHDVMSITGGVSGVRCKVERGQVTRMKWHLTVDYPDVTTCKKCPQQV